jgi:hypothetical protein
MTSLLVFAVAELFEAVLLQLSQRDLLVLQRVSRRWRDTIAGSPTVQQKLFFQPIDHAAEPELNPLLREIFPPLFVPEEVPNSWSNSRDWNNTSEIDSLDWYKDGSRKKKIMREDASWRRMYPVQPPARIEKVVKTGGCQCVGETKKTGWVKEGFWAQEEKGGVIMGGLWDLLVHVIDSEPYGEFFVEWMMLPVVVKDGDDDEDEFWEGEEDELPVIVWDGGGWRDGAARWKHWKVVPAQRNAITIHLDHSRECFPGAAVPCGLLIAECNKGIIAYESGGREV